MGNIGLIINVIYIGVSSLVILSLGVSFPGDSSLGVSVLGVSAGVSS